ncbi:esterase/lipase family protein [Streptomyces phaeochromogenes]|uniref:esterase/lipase family protein n=1 Tax=Streptomyces phaeochromogenes TaxID=1923 RepID=UPI002DD9517E|nr:alpha/beta fold hydrolase [Streptomyces phaeochromogenes]WRZ30749.1 alpha/beta hydrolase [Streptomyces phaeochromogenes]
MAERKIAVVFIHGLFSSAKTWDKIKHLLESDREMHPSEFRIDFKCFEYNSPKFKINPLRRIPNHGDIAEALKSYIEIECDEYDVVIVVTHSQGGLVLQRYLQKMLNDGRGLDLQRIKKVIMFACPNSGSELFLLARRWIFFFFPHSQAKALGTLNDAISEAQRKVVHNIVRASSISATECRIPIIAYFGSTDNIVRPVSAVGLFVDTGSMPGDHFSIIQPTDRESLVYKTVKKNLLTACRDLGNSEITENAADIEGGTDSDEDEQADSHWAFAWAADDASDSLNNVVAGAVSFAKSVQPERGIFSLRVDGNATPDGTEYEKFSTIDAVRQSRISIIITDDLANSEHCLRLLRATAEAEKPVFVFSRQDLPYESKMEILSTSPALVETFICDSSKIGEEISRILLTAGSKSDFFLGKGSGEVRKAGEE